MEGTVFDNAYRIKSDEELVAVIDGQVELRFSNHRVFVDASAGKIGTIELKALTPTTSPPPSPPVQANTPPVEQHDGLTIAEHPHEYLTNLENVYYDVNGLNMRAAAIGRFALYSLGDFSDGDISVTVRLVSGDPRAQHYGIGVRSDYCFSVSGDGTWWVNRDYGATTVQRPTQNRAISMGVINRLRLRAARQPLSILCQRNNAR